MTQPVLDALAQAKQKLEVAFERREYLESLQNGGRYGRFSLPQRVKYVFVAPRASLDALSAV
ncbi:ABC transporter ATP-binding uup domain protein [Candidatus Erwinia dacicola]|uniref:ABC transporter ATP-binding uup domain protein n=1 Tax=Candidatus Erwinia dacicola TaxID=252393 RepID=A0A328TPJ0_9GAMM|nr:ABC transporter ATP-binding uup domain protein [Candidatus Erwinia dacicola]